MANLNTNVGAYISVTQLLRLLEKKQEQAIHEDVTNESVENLEESRDYWGEYPMTIRIHIDGNVSLYNEDGYNKYYTLDELKAEILRSLQE